MNTCSNCRGALSRYDRQCSLCGAPSPMVALLDHQIEALVARGQEALKQGQPFERSGLEAIVAGKPLLLRL